MKASHNNGSIDVACTGSFSLGKLPRKVTKAIAIGSHDILLDSFYSNDEYWRPKDVIKLSVAEAQIV